MVESKDIYGFGLILMELLTGRSPADDEFGVHESIIEWARYCYSDCHLDAWVDSPIKPDAVVYRTKIVATMSLALDCTADNPAARPTATAAVKALDGFVRSNSCGLKLCSNV
nr:probably inactive leucine-rich repeat receptor-like protein kinase At2g25790 [Ipomoea batatas]